MLRLDTVKALLKLPHFIYVSFHQWDLVILVDLPDNELRVTPDDELLNPEVCRDPETGKQSLVLSSVVGGHLPGEVDLDYVLEVLSGGRDEQHTGTGALQRESPIKVHDPVAVCFLAGESGLLDFFVRRRGPLCNELRQDSALDCRGTFELQTET